ncbi:MAG: hypothetical protein A3G34_02135 [Candidatus Lindowbacteria bacterium RIFCSPLOWO2_12_FULL_62_27]|nr:MAG: hypothetical protein A3G34_02135 [Candidatus Lindowbacteria bacterium RIFCSPLOWO2_12_FULL_62_27]OGH61234.1 MAG: hypothetical protein A3I06_15655 [Candidatus Lindowbacteria bacterium RIFCSPLOWO2_02_FULL_62_12]
MRRRKGGLRLKMLCVPPEYLRMASFIQVGAAMGSLKTQYGKGIGPFMQTDLRGVEPPKIHKEEKK